MPGVTGSVSGGFSEMSEAIYVLLQQVCEGVFRAQADQTGTLQQILRRSPYEAEVYPDVRGLTIA